MTATFCDLCGLPLRYGPVVLEQSGNRLFFCCPGCRQVYQMLTAAGDSENPADFKKSELFQKCVAAGVIPGSIEDLDAKYGGEPASGTAASANAGSGEKVADSAPDATAQGLPLDLVIEGMWCPACAWVIETALQKTPGILSAGCRFSVDRAKIIYDPVTLTPDAITGVIRGLGYHAFQPENAEMEREARRHYIRLGVSAFLTMNIMMLSFALYTGFFTSLSPDAVANLSWPIAVMAAVVFFYGGASIHRKAITGITAASPGMEALITLGAGTAFAYSFYNWFHGSIHLYFDTAAMLITLVLIGKTAEQWVKQKVQSRLGAFFDLKPSKVRICTHEFPEGRYTSADILAVGDIFRVETDDALAADGRVVHGEARLDESSLTGEARPVTKKTGDAVSSGTRVIDGSLRIKAMAVGKDAMVGQFVSLMETFLEQKAPWETVTDKLLRWFVPVIVLLALSTGGICRMMGMPFETAMIRAITVMVISCPCALGVAIPLARVAGVSLAGDRGILVHEFSAFERAGTISAFVFDKTGTLTEGAWGLIDIILTSQMPRDRILAMAAGLEQHATHYIADVIISAARDKHIVPLPATNTLDKGNGISGIVDGHAIKIGSAAFMADEIADAPTAGLQAPEPGAPLVSHVYMSVNGALAAVFKFGDTARASTSEILSALETRRKEIALISGDSQTATAFFARSVGITRYQGDMRPPDKARFIETLKKQGHTVAMIGDGVNDVPALSASDMAVAVHSGRRIGTTASHITLMGNNPMQLLSFLSLARAVTATIRQNLAFTFVYNAIGIPIAMSGLLNPLVAVGAMLLSSLSVTGNTLRLILRKENKSPLHSVDKCGAKRV